MDYHRPLSASKKNPKVEIALMMAPGKGHIESGNWSTSPLLLNPGGPGGSGTFFVLGVGNALQAIVGEVGSVPKGYPELERTSTHDQ